MGGATTSLNACLPSRRADLTLNGKWIKLRPQHSGAKIENDVGKYGVNKTELNLHVTEHQRNEPMWVNAVKSANANAHKKPVYTLGRTVLFEW